MPIFLIRDFRLFSITALINLQQQNVLELFWPKPDHERKNTIRLCFKLTRQTWHSTNVTLFTFRSLTS